MADVQLNPNYPNSPSTEGGEPRMMMDDPRTKDEQEVDKKLAERLSILIEAANEKVVPLVKMVRKVGSCHWYPRDACSYDYRKSSLSRPRAKMIVTRMP